MASSDEVTITLRLADVQRFVSDAKQSEGALKDVGDEVEKTDKKSRLASAVSGGFGMLGRTLAAAGRAAVYAGAAVGSAAIVLGTKAVRAASSLNETLSKTDQIFAKSSPALKAWAANVDVSLGQSQDAALTAAANYGNLFRNLGATSREAAKMSKQLVVTASDLASFNNASPQEMLEGISSALAGEYDPLQRYGFAISAAAVEHKALEMGLAKTSKGLSAADKAQAAYKLILEQTGKAQGDFGRTSGGLANQQRILGAQWENLKAKAGQALLPAVLSVVHALSGRLMPALEDLVEKYGPRLSAWVEDFATGDGPRFLRWVQDVGTLWGPRLIDWLRNLNLSLPDISAGSALARIGAGIGSIGSSLGQIGSEASGGVADTVNVFAVAIGWLADHADTLADAMPYLAAGFILYKGAQAAANAAALVALPLQALEIVSTFSLARANRALAISMRGATVATGVNSVAVIGGTAATTGATFASRGLAAVLRVLRFAWIAATGPIGLIVLGVIAAIAIFVLMYKKVDWFRHGVDAAMRGVVTAAKAAWGWIKKNWPMLLAILTGPIGLAVLAIVKNFDKIKAGFKSLVNAMIRLWNGLDLSISVPGWLSKVPGVPDGVAGNRFDLFPDVPMLWQGGTAIEGGTALVGERGPELLNMPRGASVIPLDPATRAAAQDSLGQRVVQLVLDRRVVAEVALAGRDDMAARR